jgi:DNA-binding Xre family transcriptional regulator
MAKKKIFLKDLAGRLDISMTNLSLLKTGKVKGGVLIPWKRFVAN